MKLLTIKGVVVATILGLTASQPAFADSALETAWSPATRDGTVRCDTKYPAAGKLGKAFLHVWNNTCWSCPTGYGRTINPDVKARGACKLGATKVFAKATRHLRATGLFKTDCPKGSRQFWHIGDGYCWSCPKGYGRTTTGIKSEKACQRTIKAKFSAATKRGAPGCREGSFQHFLSNSCYRCPEGYSRSAHIRLDGKLENLPKACVKAPPPPGAVNDSHHSELKKVQKKHRALIARATEVAVKLQSHRAEIKAAAKEGRPINPQVRAATGLNALAEEAEAEGFQSLTIGATVDVSFITGGTLSAGIAHSVTDWTGVYTYSSNSWTVCCSVGADVSIEIGFWHAPVQSIAGDAHGFTIGAAYKAGAALSFWWDYCPDVEGKICILHPFLGFAVVPQLGVSAEAEYVRGTTRSAKL